MTLLELVIATRNVLDDHGGYSDDSWQTDDASCLWSNEELVGYLDLAQTEFFRRLPHLENTDETFTEFDTVIGQGIYKINASIVEVYEIRDKTTKIDLNKATVQQLDTDYPGWQTDPDSTPTHYVAQEEEHLVRFYPAPDIVTTMQMSVGRLQSKPLDWDESDSQIPEMHPKDHRFLVDFALSLAYQKHDNETENLGLAKFYEQSFDDKVGYRLDARSQRIRSDMRNLKARTRTYY